MSNNVQTTLVILLAVGYLVLILAAIIAAVIVIKILNGVRHITAKAEATTENMSELVKTLGKRIAPVALSSLMGLVVKKVKDRRKAKYFEDEDE
jgi:succinate dehydrogenase/fumarate reductase cytochrome b subunit